MQDSRRLTTWICIILAVCAAAGILWVGPAWTDVQQVPDDQKQSTFTSPAQAQRTENLAELAAAQNPETTAAMEEVELAEQSLDKALASGDPDAIAASRANLAEKEAFAEATLAEQTGIARDELRDMRETGMGWGQIAHELGFHPSVLGLGHTKGKGHGYQQSHGLTTRHQAHYTERHTKTDKAMRHSVLSGPHSHRGHAKHGRHAGSGKAGKSVSDKNGAAGKGHGHGNGNDHGGGGKGGGKK